MKPSTSVVIAILVILVLGWAVFAFFNKSLYLGYDPNNPSQYATTTDNTYGTTTDSSGAGGGVICAADAMQCPDGSYVGRTGPKCEFSCPSNGNGGNNGTSTHGTVTGSASLQQKITVNDISITPVQVTEDSRCPVDVNCIQAGTVAVMVRVETADKKQTGAFVVKLETPVAFAGYQIELQSVSPDKNSKVTISDSDYRFTFKVLK